jgi:ABC-type branched-subunit amino acid transport system substrate-binding protein
MSRPPKTRRFLLPACVLLLAPLLAWSGRAEEPSAASEPSPLDVGRQIYLEGTSPSAAAGGEKILAVLEGGAEIPAAALPCGNCHGLDGKGRPEGGVTPSNLTWPALTRPHGVRHETGREHPPYDERSLVKAIAMGVDPAGQPLHAAMPRYRMSRDDMEALVAYLKVLGTESPPGVSADRLRLGVLTPPGDRDAEAVRDALTVYTTELNEQGGIYGRMLEMVPLPSLDAATAEADDVFALLGGVATGREDELTAWAAAHDVPVIGPYSLDPPLEPYPDPHVFWMLSDLDAQVRVLLQDAVVVAREHGDDRRWLILSPEGHSGLAAARQILVEDPPLGWTADEQLVPPGVAPPRAAEALGETLAREGYTDVLALSPLALDELFLQAAAAAGWTPRIHSLGILAGPDVFDAPQAFADRIHLVFPSVPGDARGPGAELYRGLVEKRGLEPRQGTAQRTALAAAEVLAEVLKRSGRDLSRKGVLELLETGFFDYGTGLVPSLTFTPNRRVGARGGYRVTVDLAGRTFRAEGPFRPVH